MQTLESKFDKYFAEHRQHEKLLDKLTACVSVEDLEAWELKRQRLEQDQIVEPTVADLFV